MRWIKGRNPKSPGMYAVRIHPIYEPGNLYFIYFDGEGWVIGPQAAEIGPYRNITEWARIIWGEDGKTEDDL